MSEPKTFEKIVQECSWDIIKAITSGEKLESAMRDIIIYARSWSPPIEVLNKDESYLRDGSEMTSAYSLCPTDLNHFDRMRWIAREFRKRTST